MRVARNILPLTLGCLSSCGLLFSSPDGSIGSDGSRKGTSILQAAESSRIDPEGWTIPSASFDEITSVDGAGWLSDLIRKHRFHFLSLLLMEEADYLYNKRSKPPENSQLFGSPGPLDRAIFDRYSENSDAHTFLAKNKTTITRGVALGAMLMANRPDWEGLGDDLIGLIEADKFSTATSSLVKTIVGRRRPSLEEELQGMEDAERLSLLERDTSSRDSFYSDAASRAFTYAAYTDSVLARRLRGRPRARTWSAVGLYGLASYIAYTRIEQGRHYLTDVVAGAGAGFTVGKMFYRSNHREEESREDAQVSVQPVLVPQGAGLTLTIRF